MVNILCVSTPLFSITCNTALYKIIVSFYIIVLGIPTLQVNPAVVKLWISLTKPQDTTILHHSHNKEL